MMAFWTDRRLHRFSEFSSNVWLLLETGSSQPLSDPNQVEILHQYF